MPYYRLYHLGRADRIERYDDFLAPDDEAAKTYSLGRLDGQTVELWQQARLVTRFHPDAAEVRDLGAARKAAPR